MLFSFILSIISYSKKCETNIDDEYCNDHISLILSSLGIIDSFTISIMFFTYFYFVYKNIKKLKTGKYDKHSLNMLILFGIFSIIISIITFIFSLVIDSLSISDVVGSSEVNSDDLNLSYIIYMTITFIGGIVLLLLKSYYYNKYTSFYSKVHPHIKN